MGRNSTSEYETPTYLGHYRLEKTLGQGSYGKVRLATNTKTNQRVALKFIHKSSIKKPVHMTRIKREVRLLKLLHHPNIVRLYEVAETNQEIILTMEHAGGGELFDYIVAQHRLKEKEARKLFRQIISALDYCHKNCVIHRDLKPENLLLDNDRNIKIIDFGFANMFDPDSHMGTFCGSPFYASPEMIMGKKYVGPEVDIWSMGIILFALLCGHLPFDDSNVKRLYNKIIEGKYVTPDYVTPGAKDLMSRMIVIDPKERADIETIKKHPWVLEGYDVSPDPLLPNRPKPSKIDEAIIAKLSSYGFPAEMSREKAERESDAARQKVQEASMSMAAKQREQDELQERRRKEEEARRKEQEEMENAVRRRAKTLGNGDTSRIQHAAMAAARAKAKAVIEIQEQSNTLSGSGQNEAQGALETQTESAKNQKRRFSLEGAASLAAQTAANLVSSKFKGSKAKSVDGQGGMNVVKGLFNVSTTSSKSPEEIVTEVQRVLQENDIKYQHEQYLFSCQDISSNTLIKFEIELCKIQRLHMYGLHLRRVEGDTWSYKRLCHKLTSQFRL